MSQKGEVIVLLNQYAYSESGQTIHSSGQLEYHGSTVSEKSEKVGGEQRITTKEGYIHPIDIKQGLAYVSLRPYTDLEWIVLPRASWTDLGRWNPSCLDVSTYCTPTIKFRAQLRQTIATGMYPTSTPRRSSSTQPTVTPNGKMQLLVRKHPFYAHPDLLDEETVFAQ